jgi:vacuolar-type H+-ATPase subunit E/Vma4
MNGIQKIIDRIEADAAAERTQILAEAEDRCAEIDAQYAQVAQAEYQRVSRVGESVKNEANALLRQSNKEANLTVSPDTRSIRGGVIVINGDIETNCSLDALVSMQRNALSGQVAEKLFS